MIFYKVLLLAKFGKIETMKKSILALLVLPLMLGACTLTQFKQEENPGEETHQSQDENEESNQQSKPNEDSEQSGNNEEEETQEHTHEHEGNHDHEHTQIEDDEDEEENQNTGENEGNTQENTGISLDEWKEYEFHDGHEPAYHEDWDFYYGTTFEPFSNCLWENPNEDVDYSGIEFFDKKQYMESPIFVSYPKVEVRFEFWFSSHQSTKYKATSGEPQFKIDEYNSANTLINTDSIEIQKSDVPKNNTALKKTLYIKQGTMTHFNIKFNNFIPNNDSGYTAILCKISLKGWQYE